MFDSVADTMERGELFAQLCSPAVLMVGEGAAPIPCKVGEIKFHEMLSPGGIRSVRSMRVRVRRRDTNPGIQFTRGQKVTVKRKVRTQQPTTGAGPQTPGEEILALEVGDDNGSDAVSIRLTLERPEV